jgi:hypothetical protein
VEESLWNQKWQRRQGEEVVAFVDDGGDDDDVTGRV